MDEQERAEVKRKLSQLVLNLMIAEEALQGSMSMVLSMTHQSRQEALASVRDSLDQLRAEGEKVGMVFADFENAEVEINIPDLGLQSEEIDPYGTMGDTPSEPVDPEVAQREQEFLNELGLDNI